MAFKRNIRRLAVALALVVLCGLAVVLFAPTVLWAYNIQRAGVSIEQGMRWPEPRRSDSLPAVADAAALEQALVRLAEARKWRPNDAFAYRLLGRIALARQDWLGAASSFEQAYTLSPNEPLIAWEASLAYEQMQQVIDDAPTQPMFDAFANGQLSAPGQLVRSPFCSDRGAESCYFGRLSYTQADADQPDGELYTHDVLFLHPPASLSTTLLVPQNMPTLRFAVGLDPAVRDWKSDGATFRVRVSANGATTTVSEVPVDGATARLGWVRGVANLQPWAGQSVEISIESNPGPSGNPTDDWFGWADLSFTTSDAGRFALLRPRKRMVELWRAAGQDTEQFERYRDQARAAGQDESAEAWNRRLQQLEAAKGL